MDLISQKTLPTESIRMSIRCLLILISILFSSASIEAQTESPVEKELRPLDFGSVRIGVANPKRGAKSASSFVEVYGGFSIKEIAGCKVTLRNESSDKGGKFIYDVVVPLNELDVQGHIGQAAGEVGPPGSDLGQEFFAWSITYDVKERRRSIVLHDRVRRRIAANGAHILFSVREREFLDQINKAFRAAISSCK